MDEQERKLVGLILNCQPEDLKSISHRTDGSLAVVAPNGMKFVFSPVELENARDSFGLPYASAGSAAGGSTDSEGRFLAASTGSAGGVSTGSAGGGSVGSEGRLLAASTGSAAGQRINRKIRQKEGCL